MTRLRLSLKEKSELLSMVGRDFDELCFHEEDIEYVDYPGGEEAIPYENWAIDRARLVRKIFKAWGFEVPKSVLAAAKLRKSKTRESK